MIKLARRSVKGIAMYSSRLAAAPVGTAVLCVVLAAAATACGPSGKAAAPASAAAAVSASAASPAAPDVDSMTGDEVLRQIKTTMGTVSSVHVTGDVITGNQKVNFDLLMDKNQNCQGSATIDGTGAMDVVHTGAGTWIKPDDAFWQSMAAQQGKAQAGPAVAGMFKGRWLTGGQDDPDLKAAVGMCGLLAGITGDPTKSGASRGGYAFVDGQRALVVDVTDDNGNGPTILYVPTDGQPYLLREVNNGPSPGRVDLDDFNKPLAVQAPPADQVIDSGALQQQLTSSGAAG
jgi:hypothetical protein